MFSRQKQMNDMPDYPDNSWPSPKVDLNESLNSDTEMQSNEISRLLNHLDYHIENDVSFGFYQPFTYDFIAVRKCIKTLYSVQCTVHL